MHKHPGFAPADAIADFIVTQRGRQSHITAGEPLAQAQNVGADAGVLAGEQLAGATKAGGDFIGNQKHIVFITQFAHPAQVVGGIKAHAARALHDGLENDCCELVFVRHQQGFKVRNMALVPEFINVALWLGGKQLLCQGVTE